METKKFSISENHKGLRIDKALYFLLEDQSRSFVQNLIDNELVSVNGKTVKKSYTAVLDDEIEVAFPEPQSTDILPENIPLDIIYEDDDLLVVNKAKGMVVHPAPGNYNGTLVNALLHYCAGRLSTINGIVRPGIVHRIDKDTSGLLLVAKNDHAHNSLAEQIKEHSLDRCYIAVVYGTPRLDKGTVDAPIGRNPSDRKKMAIVRSTGKNAVTHYEVLKRYNGYSLVRCVLETGRTHQIRVHMASIGHPVINDPLYFSGQNKMKFDFEGQCLHAQKIGFTHPTSRERMIFTSELPEYFTKLLTKLEKM